MKIRLSLLFVFATMIVFVNTSYGQDPETLRDLLTSFAIEERPRVTLADLNERGFTLSGLEVDVLDPTERSENCVYGGNEWSGQGFKSGGSSGDDVPESFLNARLVYPHEVVPRPQPPAERTAIIVVDNFVGEQVYGIPHGQLVVAHMADILTEGNGGFGFLNGAPIYAIDSQNWNTEVMADRMTEAIARIYLDSVSEGDPITRFVFNLSFSMIPCVLADDFRGSGLGTFDAYLEALMQTNNIDPESGDYSDIEEFRKRLIALLVNPLDGVNNDGMRGLFRDVCRYVNNDYQFRQTNIPPVYRLQIEQNVPYLLANNINEGINDNTVGSAFNEEGALCSPNRQPIIGYVAASGNFAEPFPYFPAAFPEIYSVGASLSDSGSRWEYSNFAETFSPGAYFTLPFLESDGFNQDAYFGTSFAAPNVTLQVASQLDTLQPPQPDLLNPSGETEETEPQFDWDVPGDADVYIISVTDTNTNTLVERVPIRPEQCAPSEGTCGAKIGSFNIGTTYSWDVLAVNNGVGSPISKPQIFTVVDLAPTIDDVTPTVSVSSTTVTASIAINFSEPINTNGTATSVSVNCSSYSNPFTLSAPISNQSSINFAIPNPELWDNCLITLFAAQIQDNTGNQLDGNGDGTGGDDFQQPFNINNPYDVNNDFKVSPADAVFVTNRIGEPITQQNSAADVDGDNDIDEDDLNAVIAQLGTISIGD